MKSEIFSQEHTLPEHSSSNECMHSSMSMNLWLHSRQEMTRMRGTQSTAHVLSIRESKATDELRLYEVEIHFTPLYF